MTEKIVKEGVELAEKELREKQVQEVKQIVLKTLEKIKEQEKIRDEAIKQIKILKLDIDDLKEGKIDRIVERQEKDEEARRISVVIIKKEIHNHYNNPWYVPYVVTWNPLYFPMFTITNTPAIYCDGTGYSNWTITNSIASDATIGCYTLNSGDVVNLR